MIGYSSHITRRPEGSAMPASTDTTPLVSVAMRPFLMMSCCLAVLGQENLVQEYWINVHILMRSLKQLGNLRLLSEEIYVWFVRFLLQGWNANTLDQHRSELGLLGRIATRSALDPRRANGNNLETDKTKHVLCVFFQWLLPLDRSSVGCQKKIPLKQLRWGSGLCDTCYNKSSHFESMKMEFDLNMAKPVPLFLICCLAFTSCELDKFWFPRDHTSGMLCRMCNTAISTLPGLRRDLELKRAWIRKSQINIFE